MATTTYAGKIKVWAVINDIEFEVLAASMVFAMNTIPSGLLELAVGTDTSTGKPSAAHTSFDRIYSRAPVKVYCECRPTEELAKKQKSAKKDKKKYMPDGKFLIFDGYVGGRPGASQDIAGQATLTIGIVHWLSDLAYTSCVLAGITPDSADNLFSFYGYSLNPDLDPSKSAVTGFLGLADSLSNLPYDVWTAISKVFNGYARGQVIYPQLASVLGRPNNEAAVNAINRFDKVPHIVPGFLAFVKEMPTTTISTLKGYVARYLGDHTTGSTLWAKLLNIATLLQFTIIPTVESASIVNHVGQLSTFYKEIGADEISPIRVNPYQQQELAGVILTQQVRNRDHAYEANAQRDWGIVGAFKVPRANTKPVGLTSIRRAPDWYTPASLGVEAVANTIAPGVQVANGQKAKDNIDAEKVVNQLQLGNALAEYEFYDLQYRGRLGSVTGRLRFDVGPGSSVKIESVGAALITSNLHLAANVDAVELTFVAGRTAATTFHLSSIRPGFETDPGEKGLTKHPLYNGTWRGTHLLDESGQT